MLEGCIKNIHKNENLELAHLRLIWLNFIYNEMTNTFAYTDKYIMQ